MDHLDTLWKHSETQAIAIQAGLSKEETHEFWKGYVFREPQGEDKLQATSPLQRMILFRGDSGRVYLIDAYSRYLFANRPEEDTVNFVLRAVFQGNRPMSMQCNRDIQKEIEKSSTLMELFFRWNISCIVTSRELEEPWNLYITEKETRICTEFQVSLEQLRSLHEYGYLLNHVSDPDLKVPRALYKPHGKSFTPDMIQSILTREAPPLPVPGPPP